jgi:O-antigen ligase
VAGACLFFLTVDDTGFDRYQLPKELLLATCAALLAIPLVQRMKPDALDALAGAAVVLTAISTALAATPGIAERSLTLSAAAAVLFLSARRMGEAGWGTLRQAQGERGNSLVWATCVAAPAAVAALALGESFGLVTGFSPGGRAPGSSLGQRNEVAHLCLLASPAAWALAVTNTGKQRAVALTSAVLFAAAIVQTRSRAAWLLGPIVLLAWLALEARRSRSFRPLVAVGGAALLAVALSALVPSALQWRSRTPYADTLARLTDTSKGSGHGRVVQAEASLSLVGEHPVFGIGPGHWMVEYPRIRPHRDPTFDPERMLPTGRFPNADALAFLVERGLPFVLVTLALLGLALWRLSRSTHPLAPAAAAMLLGAAGLSLLDAVLLLAPAAALVAAVSGLALSAEGRDPTPTSRALSVALALLLGVAAVRAGNRLEGLWLESRPDAGLDGLEHALQWNPADVEARQRLAEALVLEQQCERAAPHLQWLEHALPHHPSTQRLARACRR